MVANLKFFESIKIRLTNFLLWNDVNKANLNAYKRISNWQPFMKRVYTPLALLNSSFSKYHNFLLTIYTNLICMLISFIKNSVTLPEY